MAKKSDQDAFQAWVEQVSSTLPEEKKNLLKSVVADEALGKAVFSGFMGEKFLYTKLNEVSEKERAIAAEQQRFAAQAGEVKGWYDTARAEYDAAMAQRAAYEKYLGDLGIDPAAALKGDAPSRPQAREREDSGLTERLDRIDHSLPPLLGAMARIVQRSIKEDIDVDPNEILQYSIKNHVNPYQAYEEMTYSVRAERAEKAREEALEKARKEGLEQGKREALAQTSSIDHMKPAGPSIFDTLSADKPRTDMQRVDAAVKSFREEVSGLA